MSIRILIADDEPEAREGLARLVADDVELELQGVYGDGLTARDALAEGAADIALLDVEMPGLNGLEVARTLDATRLPVIVFITAFDHYALEAFAARAIGYLVKPFDDEQFRDAMRRAKDIHKGTVARERAERLNGLIAELEQVTSQASTPRLQPEGEHRPPLTRLLLKSADRVALVPVTDVDWFEAADYYVRVHHHRRHDLIRETMTELEARLDPARFFRIHRSVIVNLDRVRELRPAFRGDHSVLLDDGTKLVLSRARRARFEEALGQRL